MITEARVSPSVGAKWPDTAGALDVESVLAWLNTIESLRR
jgi:hypothetical protein